MFLRDLPLEISLFPMSDLKLVSEVNALMVALITPSVSSVALTTRVY